MWISLSGNKWYLTFSLNYWSNYFCPPIDRMASVCLFHVYHVLFWINNLCFYILNQNLSMSRIIIQWNFNRNVPSKISPFCQWGLNKMYQCTQAPVLSIMSCCTGCFCSMASYNHVHLTMASFINRADYRLSPSQWETSLQSNAVSHWLGANL